MTDGSELAGTTRWDETEGWRRDSLCKAMYIIAGESEIHHSCSLVKWRLAMLKLTEYDDTIAYDIISGFPGWLLVSDKTI